MNGANPNIQDKLERTPLHLATENGHMKAVDFLTEKFKASIHERTKVSIKYILILIIYSFIDHNFLINTFFKKAFIM